MTTSFKYNKFHNKIRVSQALQQVVQILIISNTIITSSYNLIITWFKYACIKVIPLPFAELSYNSSPVVQSCGALYVSHVNYYDKKLINIVLI